MTVVTENSRNQSLNIRTQREEEKKMAGGASQETDCGVQRRNDLDMNVKMRQKYLVHLWKINVETCKC